MPQGTKIGSFELGSINPGRDRNYYSCIREVRVEADGVVIADVIQQQLVKRIIDFNYVTDAYPQYIMTFKTGETTLKNAAAKSGTNKNKNMAYFWVYLFNL